MIGSVTPLHHTSRAGYRPDIDVLRALSVMLVLLFHGQVSLFSGGFVGVDVFFVISGFLITGIINRKLEDGSFRLQDFFASRLRRIFPALFAMVLVVGALCAVLPVYLSGDEFAVLRQSMRSALLFYSNIYYYLHTGYFDTPAINQVFLHTWSLSVEAQFYLAYPFFMMFLCTGRKNTVARKLLYSTAFCFAATLLVVESAPKAAFYFFPTRMWELLLGGWLAVSRYSPENSSTKKACIAVGTGMILFAAMAYNTIFFPAFPGAGALLPCVGAALFIAGGSGYVKPGVVLSLLRHPWLIHTGLISYSLYLWHWPVFVLYRKISYRPSISLIMLPVLCAVAFVFAHLSWRFVENPIRRMFAGFRENRQFAVAAGCLLLVLVPYKMIKEPLLSYQSSYAHPVQPDVNCSVYGLMGDRDGPVEFALLGDSHALFFITLLDQLGRESGKAGRLLYSLGNMVNGYRARNALIKEEKITETIESYVVTERYETVFLVFRWAVGIRGSLPHESLTPALEDVGFVYDDGTRKLYGEEAVEEGLSDTIRFLLANGAKKIFILLPVPECSVHIPSAAASASLFHDEEEINALLGVPIEEYKERNTEALRILYAIQERFDCVRLIDPCPVLYGERKTSMVVERGKPLYSDDDHLSVTGVMLMEPLVRALSPFNDND